MTFSTFYNVGTATVANGSTAVTGSNTYWSGNVKAGDYLWVSGYCCRIASVESNTALTLARPWPGASASGAYYEAMAVLDVVGYQRAAADILTKLSGGNISSFAGLEGSANKLPLFTGAGVLGLADFVNYGSFGVGTDAPSYSTTDANNQALGSYAFYAVTDTQASTYHLPVLVSGGTLARGWDVVTHGVSGRTVQIATEVFGLSSTRGRTFIRVKHDTTWLDWDEMFTARRSLTGSNSNGYYYRLPNGLQICFKSGITVSYGSNYRFSGSWTLPSAFDNSNYVVVPWLSGRVGAENADRSGLAYGVPTDASTADIGYVSTGIYSTSTNTMTAAAIAIGTRTVA